MCRYKNNLNNNSTNIKYQIKTTMKKVLLGLFSILFLTSALTAQDVDPAKALKKVKNLLVSYNGNIQDNFEKLEQAKEMVDLAMSDATIADSYKGLITKGNVYNELIGREVSLFQLPQLTEGAAKHQIAYSDAGVVAYKAYEMALGKAVKKFETNDAIKGLQATAANLDVIGRSMAEAEKYPEAYESFKGVMSIANILKSNGVETLLSKQEEIDEYNFFTGYFAYNAGEMDATKAIFMELYEKEYDQPLVYSVLFPMIQKEDEAKALEILNKANEMYPGNKELLFAKINYYIQKEDYDNLRTELEKAVETDPDNPSVYSALGNVYMNLFQSEYAAGNVDKSEEYFNESKGYYEKALQLDDSLFDVQYSIGSLYYNKGVEITKIMNDLPISESKKYDMLNKEAKDLFNVSLPYFKKAEMMNPNDTNTMIALKEIFARNDDFTTSNEFKARLETVQGGGKVDGSFFNK